MGGKDMLVKGWNADPEWMTNEGKQQKSIMAMVARLMEAKDSSLDLTSMPNAYDI